MNYFFIHGGPGLNSNPESHLFFTGQVDIIYGNFDVITSYEQDREMCQNLYPEARVHFSDKAAHFPHLEDKKNFIDLI